LVTLGNFVQQSEESAMTSSMLRRWLLRHLLLLFGVLAAYAGTGCEHDGGAAIPELSSARDASARAASGASAATAPTGRSTVRTDASASERDATVAPTPATNVPNDAAADDGDAGTAAAEPQSTCTPFSLPADCARARDGELPDELRCAGLYAVWAKRELACGVLA
jgi:hypothetical protein